MPQVDKVSFFPQVFWLILLLILFYIFFLRYTFTNMSNILKVRNYFFIENNKATLKNKINIKIIIFKNIFLNNIFIHQLVLGNKTEINSISQKWLNFSTENTLSEIQIFNEFEDAKIDQVSSEQNLINVEN